MFKKILLVISVMVCGVIAYAANTNGLTDSWDFKTPQDMSGVRIQDPGLAGCEYYLIKDTQVVNVTSPTYITGSGAAGAMTASVRTCPVKWEALIYAVQLSTPIDGQELESTNGYLILKDTTSVNPDDYTGMCTVPLCYNSINGGLIQFNPPIRVTQGLVAGIDLDNTSRFATKAETVYAGVYFRRVKKN